MVNRVLQGPCEPKTQSLQKGTRGKTGAFTVIRGATNLLILASFFAVAACSGQTPTQQTGLTASERAVLRSLDRDQDTTSATNVQTSSILDLFSGGTDPNTAVEVNKYIWNAALQILDFMPIQTVDPFTGVIVYGFGTPPGGRTAYRATVFVQDPALDARSLNVSLASRSGPVDAETVRIVEDAILTRARELRVRDSNL